MARDFVRASSQRLGATSISPMPISAYPFTLSLWFNPAVTNVNLTMFGFGDSGTDTQEVAYLQMANDATVNCSSWSGGSGAASATATTVSSGTWYNVVGVFASATSRLVYLDGAAGTENTTNLAFPANDDKIGIGAQPDLSNNNHMDGDLAECAIWNVAINTNEISALASGVPANLIRRTALVGYWPLWGAEVGADMSGSGNNLTNTGTTIQTYHAPIGRYTKSQDVGSRFGALSLGTIIGTTSQSGSQTVTKGRIVYLYNRDTGQLEQTGTIRDDGTYEFNNVPNVNAQSYYTVILDD